jgi:hypothetical protein
MYAGEFIVVRVGVGVGVGALRLTYKSRNIQHCSSLGDEGAKVIAEALAVNTTLEILYLTVCCECVSERVRGICSININNICGADIGVDGGGECQGLCTDTDWPRILASSNCTKLLAQSHWVRGTTIQTILSTAQHSTN